MLVCCYAVAKEHRCVVHTWKLWLIGSVGRVGDVIVFAVDVMRYFQHEHIWMCCKDLQFLLSFA